MDITLQNVRKSFRKGVHAIAGIDLTFASGKITTIVGPSGSGKSTLLNLIAGLLRPDEGTIHFGGLDVTEVPPERRNIGFVFQSYALFPHLTVEENIAFALHDLRGSATERRATADSMLAMFQIGHLAARRPKELSGGEKQRVALARAVARDPRVLLLDEPLSALDAQLRERLRRELANFLHALDRTSLYVTHDRDEAMLLGDQLVVMQKGSVVQTGSPAHVYRHPRNAFVATFFGEANLIDCDFDASRRQVTSPFGSFGVAQPLSLGPSQRPKILLRPEMFSLSAGEPEVRMKVTGATFLGAKWRAEGVEQRGIPLIVDLPGDSAIAPGEIVNLRIPRSSVHVLAVDSEFDSKQGLPSEELAAAAKDTS